MSLSVENLRIYYQTLHGDVQALDGVSFSIGDGEIMGLAGESGCGKTTLGYSLIHLAPPKRFVEGCVMLDGEELPIWDNERMVDFRYKKVSIIPQYAMNALNPTRKIGKMTRELLESRRLRYKDYLPELKRRLDLVQLSQDVLDMYPIELSGGMKQRMVMVISTLLDPSLLIADEVTSALDVSTQKAVTRALLGFRDSGYVKSMIFVTHDLALTHHLADTIMVMYAGRLAEKAPSDVIVKSPRHPYTKLLLDSLPEVGVRYADRRLEGIAGAPPSLLDPPAGCRFRDRCPIAGEECAEDPPVTELAPNHYVACWKA